MHIIHQFSAAAHVAGRSVAIPAARGTILLWYQLQETFCELEMSLMLSPGPVF